MNEGWICPKCKSGVSPLVTVCPCAATITSPNTVPWATPPLIITTGGSEQRCAIADYFAANPNEKSVNLYCGCPRCSPQCSVTQ